MQASDEALAAAFKSGFVFVRRFLHVFDELCSFVGELLLSVCVPCCRVVSGLAVYDAFATKGTSRCLAGTGDTTGGGPR